MTPRERILAALDHRESDRIPIDMGSSIVTSVTKAAYVPLREYLGLAEEEIVVYDEVQQLPTWARMCSPGSGWIRAWCSCRRPTSRA